MNGSNHIIQQVGDFLQTLSWVDYIIIVGVSRGMIVGHKSGGFVELVRFAVLILTLAVLVSFTATLAAFVQAHTLLSADLSQKAVIVLLGLIAYGILNSIAGLLLKFASMENNWVMKILGILLGGFRWMVILSFVIYIVRVFQMPVLGQDVLHASRWGEAIEPIAPSVIDFAAGVVPRAALNLK